MTIAPPEHQLVNIDGVTYDLVLIDGDEWGWQVRMRIPGEDEYGAVAGIARTGRHRSRHVALAAGRRLRPPEDLHLKLRRRAS